jgi:uncharacterized protein YndB with AHSA1/START domain
MSQQTSPQAAVVIERTYAATAEALWALWTTKAGFESWWGPEGFRVEVHALEARAGGKLEYDMIADSAEAIAAMEHAGQAISHNTRGWYGEFRPHARLTLLHTIDFIPGQPPYETRIDVDITPIGDGTRMVTTLHPHLDANWTRMSAEGYTSQLKKLDRRYGWEG